MVFAAGRHRRVTWRWCSRQVGIGESHGDRRAVMGVHDRAGERAALAVVKVHGDGREGEKARGDGGGQRCVSA
ncbi:hypothetical protein AMTR_s00042p00208480 [Amborella trichopoda]|uniref:Uncharacterized protein n=1 Tax=Amborella trichopoda TaxID=13333 RepID=W1P7N0_AMBTC|nr:hypothetical protein AMTR_s00042p00208480 [Amborella trichopoda]